MAFRKGSAENSTCYRCYSNASKGKRQDYVVTSSVACKSTKPDMEVDVENLNAALHELGMLSAVTESRKEYLQEKAGRSRRQVLSSSQSTSDRDVSGFRVLQMNSEYVTGVQGTWNIKQPTSDTQPDCNAGTDLGAKQDSSYYVIAHSSRPRLSRCGLHFHKPYSVPCDAKLRRRGWSRNQDSESSKSSRDSGIGNRSNPGSPEKGAPEQNCGLVRSRSLDDIDAIQVPVSSESLETVVSNVSYSPFQRSDIESMSQRMEDLHVN